METPTITIGKEEYDSLLKKSHSNDMLFKLFQENRYVDADTVRIILDCKLKHIEVIPVGGNADADKN